MTRIALIFTVALAALCWSGPAEASPGARYGIQDDAWLAQGPGTIESRIDQLDRIGVDVVRYTLRWDQIARTRPRAPRSQADPAYRWGVSDEVLKKLRDHRIAAVVTILGTPRWANGGRAFQYAPSRARDFGDFAAAAARRFPWVRDWLIWNEPNQLRWFRPMQPRVYVQRLLNPAYAALKAANRSNRVAGGATAPRASAGGLSPVAWIRGMKPARPKMDAYAHHPHPLRRGETPWTGGCSHCATITMATLGKLVGEVRRNFGNKRIWLTEYGYQTNPPDRALGVAPALQARYLSEAAHKAWLTPYVDMLIQFLVRDDRVLAGWQSGLFSVSGAAKPALSAFRLPLAQASRSGLRTVAWGQVRARSGRQPYRIRQFRNGRWYWVGAQRWTNARGVFAATLRAGKGARIHVFSPRDNAYSAVLVVR
jgi:hypothetical protein